MGGGGQAFIRWCWCGSAEYESHASAADKGPGGDGQCEDRTGIFRDLDIRYSLFIIHETRYAKSPLDEFMAMVRSVDDSFLDAFQGGLLWL